MNGWPNYGCTTGLPMMIPIYPMGEVRFWLEIQREHTIFIRSVINGLETVFVRELEAFEKLFAEQEGRAVSIMGLRPLVDDVYVSSSNFLRLLERIKADSSAAQNPTAQELLTHMIAETRYFLRILAIIKARLSYSF